MEEKVQNALKIIEVGMANTAHPAIAWSGGKDSMALLHLIMRKAGHRLPVIFFREQWQPHKYAFQNRIIEKWGLEVYTWHPSETAFQQNGDEFEVQNKYVFGGTPLTCPTGITPPEDGQPWVCSLEIYNRPLQQPLLAKWGGLFIGHKRCDGDPIYGGDAGTRIQYLVNPNGYECDAIYPIHDWTHEDVFAYCEAEGVPIQADRYEQVDGKWRERKDKAQNCDYVHACTRCVDRREDAEKFVRCPKLGLTVENVSRKVRWTDNKKLSYMED